jgi:NADPH-dependent curcumin reductase CurA
MKAALAAVCPNGIDVYFDNTGGPITDAVFELIALRARVVICGQISQYSGGLDSPNLGPRFLHHILYKRATIVGILARDYTSRMDEMLEQMSEWIQEGKIKYRETFVEGFANLPAALNSLFHGKNTGKLVVTK